MESVSRLTDSISNLVRRTEENLSGFKRTATFKPSWQVYGNLKQKPVTPLEDLTFEYGGYNNAVNRTWDERQAGEETGVYDMTGVKDQIENIINEKHKSFNSDVQFLTEKMQQMEQRVKLNSDKIQKYPKRYRSLETNVRNDTEQIRSQFSNFVKKKNLKHLENAFMTSQKQATEDFTVKLDDLRSQLSTLHSEFRSQLTNHMENLGSTQANNADELKSEILDIFQTNLENFETEYAEKIEDTRASAKTFVQQQVAKVEEQLSSKYENEKEAMLQQIEELKQSNQTQCEEQGKILEGLQKLVQENLSADETSKSQMNKRFTSFADQCEELSSVISAQKQETAAIINELQTNYTAATSQISELTERLDEMTTQAQYSQRERGTEQMNLVERIENLITRLDEVDTRSKNTDVIHELKEGISSEEKALYDLEVKFDAVLERVIALESIDIDSLRIGKEDDEKEQTFGKELKGSLNPSSPELMTISLNDLGESDNESVTDFLSPKASPMNRMPGAPTHAPKSFNFAIPAIKEAEEHREEESPIPSRSPSLNANSPGTQSTPQSQAALSQSQSPSKDKDTVARMIFAQVLNEEMQQCLVLSNDVQQQREVLDAELMSGDSDLEFHDMPEGIDNDLDSDFDLDLDLELDLP